MFDLIAKLLPGRAMLVGVAALVVVSLVLGGAAFVVNTIRNDARQGAIREIQNANDAAERKANDAERDVEKCYGSGGRWNRASGLCDGPAGR